MRRSAIIIILAAVMVFPMTISTLSADPLNDAIQRQRQIEQSRKQAENKLNSLQKTEEIKKKELSMIIQQLDTAKINLTEAEDALREVEEEVQISRENLEETKQQLADRQETLGKRVRNIYEEGQLSYLDILFQSTDLSDFITRVEYFKILVENDQNLLADIKEQKQLVENKTAELQQKRDLAAELQQSAVNAKLNFDQKKSAQQKTLAEIEKSQEELFIQIEKLEADSKKLEETIRNLQAANKNGVVGTIRIWPLPGYYTISSDYGWRIHPITRKRSLHTGVDIPAPAWTPLLAAAEGTVIYSGWYSAAYGNAVIIDHGNGMSTMYHQVKVATKYGDIVKAGQVIGYVGSTGWSTGPHTHLEVRKNGVPVNPMDYFK